MTTPSDWKTGWVDWAGERILFVPVFSPVSNVGCVHTTTGYGHAVGGWWSHGNTIDVCALFCTTELKHKKKTRHICTPWLVL